MQDLQELQCLLMVHIGKFECKSKLLMCIFANRCEWDYYSTYVLFYQIRFIGWMIAEKTLFSLLSALRQEPASPSGEAQDCVDNYDSFHFQGRRSPNCPQMPRCWVPPVVARFQGRHKGLPLRLQMSRQRLRPYIAGSARFSDVGRD